MPTRGFRILLVFAWTLLFASIATSAQAGLENFCRKDSTQSVCLRAFLNYKCTSYFALRGNLKKQATCKGGVQKMVSLLDLGSSPPQGPDKIQEEVAFKKLLKLKIESAETGLLLMKIREQLDEHLARNETFWLWDQMLKHSRENASLAMENMAVLFQDATEYPNHIFYLKKLSLTPSGRRNVLLLEELLSYFSREALEQLSLIRVYPAAYSGQMNHTFYHFYLITYLSQQLRNRGVSDEMSFFVPFMFNTQYELKNVNPRWPYRDPNQRVRYQEFKLREIYGGYLGAMAGVSKGRDALSYSTFSRLFEESPFKFLAIHSLKEFADLR